ncbi:hypothetical protein TNCV_4778541 [Trichonephila clavipes]|nr:hypothetical protein TNCV_4778541 [Trichonephila clavipes]
MRRKRKSNLSQCSNSAPAMKVAKFNEMFPEADLNRRSVIQLTELLKHQSGPGSASTITTWLKAHNDIGAQLARDLADGSGGTISRQTPYSCFANAVFYALRIPLTASNRKDRVFVELKTSVMYSTKMGRDLFSHKPKFPRKSDYRRVFIWGESKALCHPSYITNINRFRVKESLCVMA